MSDYVLQVHGYGFVFAGNFIGIVPAQFLAFLEQAPQLKRKVQDNAPDFLEKVEEMMQEGEGLAGEKMELDELLSGYEWDGTSCNGLAALYVDAANEVSGIGLEVQRDDDDGNIVMLEAAAPWQFSKKQMQIESQEHLSAVLKACCDKTGIVCNIDVQHVTAEMWD